MMIKLNYLSRKVLNVHILRSMCAYRKKYAYEVEYMRGFRVGGGGQTPEKSQNIGFLNIILVRIR